MRVKTFHGGAVVRVRRRAFVVRHARGGACGGVAGGQGDPAPRPPSGRGAARGVARAARARGGEAGAELRARPLQRGAARLHERRGLRVPAGEQPLLPDGAQAAGRDARHADGRAGAAARNPLPAAPQPRGRDVDGRMYSPEDARAASGVGDIWEAGQFEPFMGAVRARRAYAPAPEAVLLASAARRKPSRLPWKTSTRRRRRTRPRSTCC